MSKTTALILAAGKGTRMKSDIAKVLHKLDGRPLVDYVIDAVNGAGIKDSILVVGHQKDAVKEAFKEKVVAFADQDEQLGTGHAVIVAEKALKPYDRVLILCGDTPLLKVTTLQALIETDNGKDFCGSMLSVLMADPKQYGRVKRNELGGLEKIVEFKDSNKEELAIKEINVGVYYFDTKILFEALKDINSNNNQNEYYLTDVLEICTKKGYNINIVQTTDADESIGVNSVEDLEYCEKLLKDIK